MSGTLVVAVEVVVPVAAAPPRLPRAAVQRRPQRRLEAVVPPQVRLPRAAEHSPVAVERRLPAAVVGRAAAVVAAAVPSPAVPIRMAPSTRGSLKWLATPTACRRCSSGRRT